MPTKAISLTIVGAPVPKGRPRFGNGHAFTPKRTRDYEKRVREAGSLAMQGGEPLTGPLALELVAFMPIAASWHWTKRQAARDGEIYPTSRPDLDNIEKAITDALNGVVYADDSQIVQVTKAKAYGENPRVFVRVVSLD